MPAKTADGAPSADEIAAAAAQAEAEAQAAAQAEAASAAADAAKQNETPAVPDGFCAMRHPEHVGCSWRGVPYEPNGEGAVIVPLAAVGDLASFGFSVV